jgi:hypothetical protein
MRRRDASGCASNPLAVPRKVSARLIAPLGLVSFLCASAVPPPSPAARGLAPGQPDFLQHKRALTEKLAQADALGVALMRIQNAIGGILSSAPQKPCESEQARSLAARTRPLGAAYRDAAQSARAEAARVRSLMQAPTLAPLLQEEDRNATESLLQRSGAHSHQYLESAAWQERFVEPLLRQCQVKLVPAEGLPGAGPAGEREEGSPVAVLGIGGGRICPGNYAADGRVLVLLSPKACYGGPACACEPRPVLPGAVLGPPAATSP